MGQLPMKERDQRLPAGRRKDDEPLLPETTRDEREPGWGDEPGERDEDWYRRERPPHHE
jgi:hypothetical protein